MLGRSNEARQATANSGPRLSPKLLARRKGYLPFVDLRQFFADYQDHLASKLDTYEQAIYLYVFRHSRLLGVEEVLIRFKSARKKMALGIGMRGRSMSETTCYEKLNRCFYRLRKLDDQNHVIERVRSRPEGTNGYRNVVAACRQCNDRKNASPVDDWLRTLYRDGFLGAAEYAFAYSERWRSAFRGDGDRDSERMPITIPR